MSIPLRSRRFSARLLASSCACLLLTFACRLPAAEAGPGRDAVLGTMKRATTFMVEKVATKGGYVWSYLPDFSRRWGEIEARESMIWIQAPGTPEVGHLYLDAYHATGDEYYYQAAEQVGAALIWGQHPSGGWNYVVDFAGERSLREWYQTVGRNAWRLEEFQHYYGNATFDDAGTAQSSKFLLRLYVEKRDPKYRAALEHAISFVLDSQYPSGGWPQRFPLKYDFQHHGHPDYTSFITLNDDVAAENIEFLTMCYHSLGDARLLEPIRRAMDCFILTQQGQPQPGWALQYTTDLKPAGARTYEPQALATHATAAAVESLMDFYKMTGDTRFLARISEALAWLDKVRLPKELAVEGRTHPTFIEVGRDRPIYLHRRGTNVVNGEYYCDDSPEKTVGHYSSFRSVDVSGLRAAYEKLVAMPVAEATKDSPLLHGTAELPRFYTARSMERFRHEDGGRVPSLGETANRLVSGLNAQGYWPTPLRMTSHRYIHDGDAKLLSEEASTEKVGDATDTSPYADPNPVLGISTGAYVRNMALLIDYLAKSK